MTVLAYFACMNAYVGLFPVRVLAFDACMNAYVDIIPVHRYAGIGLFCVGIMCSLRSFTCVCMTHCSYIYKALLLRISGSFTYVCRALLRVLCM